MSDEVKYGFSESIQVKIVSMLLYDQMAFLRYMELVKPESFDNPILQYTVATIFGFFEKYKRNPVIDELLEELELVMQKKKVPPKAWTEKFEEIVNIGEEFDFNYVRDKVVDFARYQAVKKAMMRSAQELEKKKDYEGIVKIIKDAVAIGDTKEDIGIFYYPETENRLAVRKEQRARQDLAVSTGIKKLDEMLGGGLGYGELGILMSPMKRGKTITAVNFSKGALMEHKNVLHIGLEGSEDRTQVLYDSSISGVPKNQLVDREEEVKEFIDYFFTKAQGIGQLVIKHYPAWSCSTLTIEALLQRLQLLEGFEPDLLIIDYLGLMRNADVNLKVEASSGGKYFLLGQITKEILSISQKYKLSCWLLHQATRKAKEKDKVDLQDSGDSIEPMRDADLILTLNQSEAEAGVKGWQKMRVFVAGGREVEDRHNVDIVINKATCQIVEDSEKNQGEEKK